MNTQTEMKELVKQIFGEDAANDDDIVNFYKAVMDTAIKESGYITIQQALEVWDEAQLYGFDSGICSSCLDGDAPRTDKRTYFRYKFGIDIDKM